VAFQPREYGSAQSYRDFVASGAQASPEQVEKDIEELWE
jgi:hypothetical protein